MLAPLNAPSSSAVAGGWHGVESTFAAARPLIDPGRQPQSQGGPPSGPVTSYVVAGRGVLEAVVTYNNTRASHLARACSCSLVFALLAPLLVSFAPATNPWIGACNPLQVDVLLWENFSLPLAFPRADLAKRWRFGIGRCFDRLERPCQLCRDAGRCEATIVTTAASGLDHVRRASSASATRRAGRRRPTWRGDGP